MVLFQAMANVIIAEKLYDSKFIEARVEGFDSYVKEIQERVRPNGQQEITGVPADLIREAARTYASARVCGDLLGDGDQPIGARHR